MDDVLFRGRLVLKEEDRELFDKIQAFMEENSIKTIAGAIKLMLERYDNVQENPIKHVHYWLPVNKEDIPLDVLNNTPTS